MLRVGSNYTVDIVKYSGGSESASWFNQFNQQPVTDLNHQTNLKSVLTSYKIII